jgi:antitoxin (DNA-binding transcriptional repressor) of toxin-antitoxin stability system
VITRHGKPVAKLIPIASDSARLIGSLAGKVEIKGDILSTGTRWDASRSPRDPRPRPARLESGAARPVTAAGIIHAGSVALQPRTRLGPYEIAVLHVVVLLALSSLHGAIPRAQSSTDDDPLEVRAFVIEVDGGEITRTGKIPGRLRVVGPYSGLEDLADSPVVAESGIGIELHGSSTLALPKTSYDVELRTSDGEDRDLALVGLPAGSDWILHGCGRDKTCLRNAFTYDLARRLGRYAPRTRFVELVLGGRYQGLYLLTEKVRRDGDRVDLPRPAGSRAAGDITGGYIFKMDLGEGTDEDPVLRDWLSPVSGVVYTYYYPRFDDITAEQRAYLQDHVAAFESLMDGPRWNDPDAGYRAWLDVPTWVDFALLQELSGNTDAYVKSVYLQKYAEAEGGMLGIGPVWDFDNAYGVAEHRDGRRRDVWAHTMNRFGGEPVRYDPPGRVPYVRAYWERLWSDPGFQNDLQCRWQALRAGPLALDSMTATIDVWVDALAPPRGRDGELWRNPGEEGYPSEIGALKEWLDERVSWMDANLPGVCAP